MENLSPNLSPARREALNSFPSVAKSEASADFPVQQNAKHPLASPFLRGTGGGSKKGRGGSKRGNEGGGRRG